MFNRKSDIWIGLKVKGGGYKLDCRPLGQREEYVKKKKHRVVKRLTLLGKELSMIRSDTQTVHPEIK
jgi:hypothetical protein